jgi:hypothetical protein
MDDGRWLVALSLGALITAGRFATGSRGTVRKHRFPKRDDPAGEVPRQQVTRQPARQIARPTGQRQVGSQGGAWVLPSPSEMLQSLDRRDRLLMQTIPRIPTL